MKITSLIRYSGSILFGAALGGAAVLWWQASSLQKDLNQAGVTQFSEEGDASLASGGASWINDPLHQHDTYYAIPNQEVILGLAAIALVSIFLIYFAGAIGRRVQAQNLSS